MSEIKLSQGAKPGDGGMLLGNKVTSGIALARGMQNPIRLPTKANEAATLFSLINLISGCGVTNM